MNIFLKTEDEIELMRQANQLVGKTLGELAKHIKPGVTTLQLDRIADEFIRDNGAIPTFKGFPNPYGGPFPASICTSVNQIVVHGIPNEKEVLKEGDIISIDVGVKYKGFNGDSARTFPVGKVKPEVKKLIKVTEESFFEGIKGLKAGDFVGDISHRIQTYVEKHGYSIVRELVGHGVGRHLHEDPQVPNFGRAGSGARLNAGVTIAIEPMVNMGERNVVFLSDGWTCATRDGLPSAHYENTILITETGVEILT